MDRRTVTLAHGGQLKCPCCSAYHFVREAQAEDPREPAVRVYECVRCRWRGTFAGASDRVARVAGRTAILGGTLLVSTVVAGELYVLRPEGLFGLAALLWPAVILTLVVVTFWVLSWLFVMQRGDFRATMTVAATFAGAAIAAGPLGYFPLPVWQRSLGVFVVMAGVGFVARRTSAGNSMSAMEQFNLLLSGANATILVLVALVATLGLSGIVNVASLTPAPTSPLVVAANLAGPLVVAAVIQLVPLIGGLAVGFYARSRQ